MKDGTRVLLAITVLVVVLVGVAVWSEMKPKTAQEQAPKAESSGRRIRISPRPKAQSSHSERADVPEVAPWAVEAVLRSPNPFLGARVPQGPRFVLQPPRPTLRRRTARGTGAGQRATFRGHFRARSGRPSPRGVPDGCIPRTSMARRAPARGVPAFFLSYWLPVLLYLTIIFFLSAQPSLTPPLQFANSDKLYHVGEYFGLGILLVRAIRASSPSMRVLNAALVALCLGIVVGTGDEMFQSTPFRGGSRTHSI